MTRVEELAVTGVQKTTEPTGSEHGSASLDSGHQATRERIIAVASHLFAEETVDGVSIRRITREAKVGTAAVHYHFSDKDTLLVAIIQHLGADVLRQITSRARTLAEGDRELRCTEVVEVIARPYFDLLDRQPVRGQEWIRIVAQLAQINDDRLRAPSQEATTWAHAMLKRAFPDVREDRRLGAWSLAVNSLLAALGRAHGSNLAPPGQTLTRSDLVKFMSAGLAATLGTE